MSEEKLPKGWKRLKLGEVLTINMGQSPPSSSYNEIGEGLPFFQGKTEFGKIYPSVKKYTTDPKKVAEENSVLLSVRAPVGPTNLAPFKCCIGRGLASISSRTIPFKYIFYFFRNNERELSQQGTGTTFSAINKSLIYDLDFPVPPLPEQQRIVSHLDAIFGHLDVLKEKLDRIPVLLKNFRQQVLTQAVTGELTREWREGEGLPKQKAKEIRNKDYSLDDIPNEWVHTIIGTIASVKGGKRLPKEEALTEEITNHPYIRARDLKKGTVLTENLLYITEDVYEKISRYIVNEGDVYITIVGAKIGDAGIIPESMDGANLTENAAKLTEMQYVIPTYLSIWLRSPICQSFIQKTIMSAAQGKLALTRIKSLPIYLPHLVEQEKIVSTVESLFSLADKIESQYQSLKAKIDQLPQATLAKAFRGELVGQEVKEYVREVGELAMVANRFDLK